MTRFVVLGTGSGPCRSKWCESIHGGSRPTSQEGLAQPWPAWGARTWRHVRPGNIILGVLGNQAAKSSTMKGPTRACR